MYNRIFKNNQVTYGRPYQIKIPVDLQALLEKESEEELLPGEPEESRETILDKAREEAALILKEAEYEAEKVLEDARAEAERNTRAVLEEAWQKGYDEGNEAAKEQYAGILLEAEAARDSAMEEHDQVLAGMEAEIVALVTEVASKVIENEISTHPETILYLVRLALENCSNKSSLVLKVAPEDFEYISGNRDRLSAKVPSSGDMEVRQDLSLKPGACILETPFGNVDAGADTRLQKIEEAFREILEGR